MGHDITLGQKALALSKEKMRDKEDVRSSERGVVVIAANKSNDTNSKPSARQTLGAFLMANGCVV